MTTLAPGAAFDFTKNLAPGLLVTALVAMAAALLGSHYKGSMLLGLGLRFVGEDKRCGAGIQFASSTLLRLGVALLGLRLTINHGITVGWQTVVALAAGVSPSLGIAFRVVSAE